MDPNKKQNLIYIGIALGVLTLTIVFTQLNLGKYFLGKIDLDPNAATKLTEIQGKLSVQFQFIDSGGVMQTSTNFDLSKDIAVAKFVLGEYLTDGVPLKIKTIRILNSSNQNVATLLPDLAGKVEWVKDVNKKIDLPSGVYSYEADVYDKDPTSVLTIKNSFTVIGAANGSAAQPASSTATPPNLKPLFTEELSESDIPEDDEETDEIKPPDLKPVDFEDGDSGDGTTKLKDVTAFPKGFNPQLNATKISYSVTGIGKVDIKIHNLKGDSVATLVTSQSVEKKDYEIWWDGTDDNKSGTLLEPGTYTYKITLKDSEDKNVLDTATGSLNLIYPQVAAETPDTPDNGTVKATSLKSTSNSQAVVSMQNATAGTTAGTGPGTLIYLLFPAAGYIISRRK